MTSFFVHCRLFTISVITDGRGVIVSAAPVARKFLGQRIEKLLHWAGRFGDPVDVVEIGLPERKDSP